MITMKRERSSVRWTIWALAACLAAPAAAAALGPKAPPSRFAALVAEALKQVPLISGRALKARIEAGDSFHLIDVREDAEWAQGHLPGAVHLSRGVLEREIETLVPDPAADIVVYCASGARSALAAESLRRMGYAKVSSLEGGLRAWLDSGDPIVKK